MPSVSTRFPTTRSTYLPSTTEPSYRKSSLFSGSGSSSSSGFGSDLFLRRSSLFGSYRNYGDDTSISTSRSGVSTHYTTFSSTSNPLSSSSSRLSIDREYRKPPIGSRLRSESRFRDQSLDSGYTSSTSRNNDLSRLSTSSLARSLATSGADLYEKYSPANYKPKCELSRSRSLTDSTANKLVDSISGNNHSGGGSSSNSITNRPSSRDRSSSVVNGSLLAGNASHTKDYVNNRSTSPIASASIKVKKTNANFSVLPISLANSRCLHSNNSNNNTNNNNNINSNLSQKNINDNLNNNNINNNNNNSNNNTNNNLSDSIVVTAVTNPLINNSKKSSESKKLLSNSACTSSVYTIVSRPAIAATASLNVVNSKPISAKTTTIRSKNSNGTTAIPSPDSERTMNNNNNHDCKLVTSNESFKKRLGNNPLAPYKNPNFLKCEYDLARSQVINSRSKSANSETNNNNINIKTTTSRSASPAKDTNLNKITIFGVNSTSPSPLSTPQKHRIPATEIYLNDNMHCIQHNNVDLLDDIKYIDSDESDRKHSPNTMKISSAKEFFNDGSLNKNNITIATLPSVAVGKKLNDTYSKKYNTISNGNGPHQINIQISNGIAITPRKAVAEEMTSSTSSSTSTLSALTESSTSSLHQTNATIKDLVKVSNLDGNGDNARASALRSALPPTPTRLIDRDGKSSASRTLSDSDAFNKSLAASSISDKDDDVTEGLCGLRNIGNTCFMNSVIQCLSHTKELTRYLRTKADGRCTSTKDSRIVTEFIKLIKDMWSGTTRSVTPSELKSAFSSKHRMYSGCSQQDAQEFLRFFLDALHCTLNAGTTGEKLEIDDNLSNNRKADLTWDWYSKVENSVIKDLFVGQLKSSLKCTVCGNTSVTFDPFWDLSVSLSTSSRCKLESCLDLFIKEEVLDGDEMPTCSKCKTRRKSTKSFTIQRFPKYLVIHLKRFSETRWSKLTNIVEFPIGERELNMAPYAANSSSATYSLYGICNHMGSTAGGHYVAVCKHPVTRKWHEFNDNIVTPAYESGLISSSAYVLFYERAPNIIKSNATTRHQPFKNCLEQSNVSFNLPFIQGLASQYFSIHNYYNTINYNTVNNNQIKYQMTLSDRNVNTKNCVNNNDNIINQSSNNCRPLNRTNSSISKFSTVNRHFTFIFNAIIGILFYWFIFNYFYIEST